MDKILKAEVFVHSNGQLRAVHLILGNTPISKSFQAHKCVIKAKDPQLHQISVAAPGFLITGLILEGTLATIPIPEGVPRVAPPLQRAVEEATSSQLNVKEEEEEEEDKGVVELTDSEEEFVVFDQPLSLESQVGNLSHPSPVQANSLQEDIPIPEEMGIQRKQRSTLQELLESQPGGKSSGKTAQTWLPTLPPAQHTRADHADHKRKREDKGKEVMEKGRTPSSQEVELQRGSKQPRGMQTRLKGRMSTKLQPHPRPHHWSWMGLLYQVMLPFETFKGAWLGT